MFGLSTLKVGQKGECSELWKAGPPVRKRATSAECFHHQHALHYNVQKHQRTPWDLRESTFYSVSLDAQC